MSTDTTAGAQERCRRCNWCGAEIDPVDWCPNCSQGKPCSSHNRLRKRSDAQYCNDVCRSKEHSTMATLRRQHTRKRDTL